MTIGHKLQLNAVKGTLPVDHWFVNRTANSTCGVQEDQRKFNLDERVTNELIARYQAISIGQRRIGGHVRKDLSDGLSAWPDKHSS